jgi:hypothetical protein
MTKALLWFNRPREEVCDLPWVEIGPIQERESVLPYIRSFFQDPLVHN